MARNGSGSYAKVNTFVAGNSITAAGHNQNWDDLATEMTNSVAADGQTTISGQLKGATGTKTAPSYAFSADLDTGMYRIGANNLGISCGDTKIIDVTTSGATVVGTLTATAIQQGGAALIPAGVIVPYAGSAAPTGWLLCDGSSLVRTDYAALFTAIGTTYGSADGTHFTVPDLGGRTIAGKEASATRLTTAGSGVDGGTLGSAGGTQNITILQANLPVATLTTTITDPGHTHTPLGGNTFLTSGGGIATSGSGEGLHAATTSSATTGITASTALGGSGTAAKITQPTIILNYIIKT